MYGSIYSLFDLVWGGFFLVFVFFLMHEFTISEAQYFFKYFLPTHFYLLFCGPAWNHCSVHHVAASETEDCSAFLAQEDVMGTRLLQHHEFFQSLSLQVSLGGPFYVETQFMPP